MNVSHIRKQLKELYLNGDLTESRAGDKTVEILGASFLADEPAIYGSPSADYIEREIEWYNTQSTNVNDIRGTVPAAWVATANAHGEINSNYGKLIFSPKYFEQYKHVVDELKWNSNSRRASMIYTRPSIWLEYCENGKNDFICTNSVTYYIRNEKLHCVVQMRSNDAVYGYKNDYAWQQHVLRHLALDLKVDVGDMYWQVQNLHIYFRHFHLME
jgi:thymidylate synthase